MIRVVLAGARRGDACRVLPQDHDRLEASRQKRAEVPNRRGQPVTVGQRVAAAHRRRLLSETAVQATYDVALLEQYFQTFLQRARQAQEATKGVHVPTVECLQLVILARVDPQPGWNLGPPSTPGKCSGSTHFTLM